MKKRFCLFMIIVLFMTIFSGCAQIGASGVVFFIEYEDLSDSGKPRMLRKQDLSKRKIEDICPADFYLVEGFTENVAVRAAREHVGIGETEILTIYEDGRIQTDCVIKDNRLLHVLAAHGDDYYYSRLTENKEYCCEFVRLNKNGDTFIYPYMPMQSCFCPSVWEVAQGLLSPADNNAYSFSYPETVSSAGRIAFNYVEYYSGEVIDGVTTAGTNSLSEIFIIDSDGSVKNIGEGEYPAWLNDDILLFVNEEGVLHKYSVKEKTTEAFKTEKGKTIQLSPLELDSGISVSKDGKKLVCMTSLALGGGCATWVSLETGKDKRFKWIISGCIIYTARVFFGS